MYYAQITNGVCSAITQTAGTITAPNMVELQSFDTSLIGHSYANGVFTAPPVVPVDPRAAAKAAREIAVAAIKVTTQAGNTFDGDEVSQGRMARAILALSTNLAPSVNWVLADNSVIQATQAELTEALVLAGQAQAALWVLPE